MTQFHPIANMHFEMKYNKHQYSPLVWCTVKCSNLQKTALLTITVSSTHTVHTHYANTRVAA